ncbi:hypothetical protein [Algoriphagus boritolerans]
MLIFIITKQFVWTLFTCVAGMTLVAAILLHVSLDVLKRLEFKEM